MSLPKFNRGESVPARCAPEASAVRGTSGHEQIETCDSAASRYFRGDGLLLREKNFKSAAACVVAAAQAAVVGGTNLDARFAAAGGGTRRFTADAPRFSEESEIGTGSDPLPPRRHHAVFLLSSGRARATNGKITEMSGSTESASAYGTKNCLGTIIW